jgi:LacI family transcriptional regulator
MSDVARMCGVSATTVSYVLGGRDKDMRIPEATKERILAACGAVNYRRNHLASSLARGRTGTVGVVFPNARGDFMNDSLWGIREVLGGRQYESVVALSEDDPDVEARHLEFFADRRVDAIIAFPVWAESGFGHWGAALADPNRPVVFVDMAPPLPGVACIAIDDAAAGRDAARKAAECGAQSAVVMEPRSVAPTVVRRLAGFREGARKAGLPVETVLDMGDSEALGRVLRSAGKAVMAVFTPVAGMLVPALARVSRGGHLAPQHLIVSVGEVPEAVFLPNPWWMLRQDAVGMGREAARVILDSLEGDAPAEGSRTVPCSWACNRDMFTR